MNPDTIPTLPCDIPGLLRRGSPVRVVGRSSWPSGVCIMPGDGDLWLVSRGLRIPRQAAPQDLALDLSDATGRCHAAWWLAGHFALVSAPHELLRVTWTYRGMWDLDGPRRRVKFAACVDSRFAVEVPALDVLVINNDRRTLPDGSRWVDAEALRCVCLHVAGLEAP